MMKVTKHCLFWTQTVDGITWHHTDVVSWYRRCIGLIAFSTRLNLTPVLVVLVSESRYTQLWLEAVRYSWNRSYSTHFDLLLFFLLFLYMCILTACLLLLHLSIFHDTLYGRQDAAMDRSPVHHPSSSSSSKPICQATHGHTWTTVKAPGPVMRDQAIEAREQWVSHAAQRVGEGTGIYMSQHGVTYCSANQRCAPAHQWVEDEPNHCVKVHISAIRLG